MNIDISSAKVITVARTNVPDCFVLRNKIGTAHGEAKLYVGGTNLRDWNEFFDNFTVKGLVLKSDILSYLELAKDEYINQTQGYRLDISGDWSRHLNTANQLSEFNIFDIVHKEYSNRSRYYINSQSSIYTFIRQFCLPVMTTLLLEKICVNGTNYIWFRPYINDIGNIYETEIISRQIDNIKSDVAIDETTKEQIIQARVGQGKYRNLIIEKFHGECAVTGVNDTRILIASHIKPWSDSNNAERIDVENGLLLCPTFDKLFDKGFISFKNNGQIILSDYFDERNFKKLKIDESIVGNLHISSRMKQYLDYHRDVVFKN